MFKVGKVVHFYDKIGVAIVELDGTLSVGDKIKFTRGGEDLFEENVASAKKGDVIGLKTTQEVKEGSEVYKAG